MRESIHRSSSNIELTLTILAIHTWEEHRKLATGSPGWCPEKYQQGNLQYWAYVIMRCQRPWYSHIVMYAYYTVLRYVRPSALRILALDDEEIVQHMCRLCAASSKATTRQALAIARHFVLKSAPPKCDSASLVWEVRALGHVRMHLPGHAGFQPTASSQMCMQI